jgi:hypothetical protein
MKDVRSIVADFEYRYQKFELADNISKKDMERLSAYFRQALMGMAEELADKFTENIAKAVQNNEYYLTNVGYKENHQ